MAPVVGASSQPTGLPKEQMERRRGVGHDINQIAHVNDAIAVDVRGRGATPEPRAMSLPGIPGVLPNRKKALYRVPKGR